MKKLLAIVTAIFVIWEAYYFFFGPHGSWVGLATLVMMLSIAGGYLVFLVVFGVAIQFFKSYSKRFRYIFLSIATLIVLISIGIWVYKIIENKNYEKNELAQEVAYNTLELYADLTGVVVYENPILRIYGNRLVCNSLEIYNQFCTGELYEHYEQKIEEGDYEVYKYEDIYIFFEKENDYVEPNSKAFFCKKFEIGEPCYQILHIAKLQFEQAINEGKLQKVK